MRSKAGGVTNYIYSTKVGGVTSHLGLSDRCFAVFATQSMTSGLEFIYYYIIIIIWFLKTTIKRRKSFLFLFLRCRNCEYCQVNFASLVTLKTCNLDQE